MLTPRQARVSTALALFPLRSPLTRTHALCCFCFSGPHSVPPLLDTMTLRGGGGGLHSKDLKRNGLLALNDKCSVACSVSEYPSQNAVISPELWLVFLSDRTFIVRPPEDSTVIKGTTATLRCEATHDPRISIRLVVSVLVCVVYQSLIL